MREAAANHIVERPRMVRHAGGMTGLMPRGMAGVMPRWMGVVHERLRGGRWRWATALTGLTRNASDSGQESAWSYPGLGLPRIGLTPHLVLLRTGLTPKGLDSIAQGRHFGTPRGGAAAAPHFGLTPKGLDSIAQGRHFGDTRGGAAAAPHFGLTPKGLDSTAQGRRFGAPWGRMTIRVPYPEGVVQTASSRCVVQPLRGR